MKKRGFQKLAPMAAKRSLTGAKTQMRPITVRPTVSPMLPTTPKRAAVLPRLPGMVR